MPFGITESLIGVGGAFLGGLFGKKPQPTVTDTTPTYTAGQSAVQGQLQDSLMSRLAHPTDYVTSQRNAAVGRVNDAYSGAQDNIQNQLIARGFGKSGKVGTNVQKMQLGRAGAIGGLQGQFAALQQQYDESTTRDAEGFAFANPGSHSVQSGGGTGGVGSGFGAASQTASFMYALNHFLGGGDVSGLGDMDHTVGGDSSTGSPGGGGDGGWG